MIWIIACLVFLAFVFYTFGRRWESGLKRPELNMKALPLVSILIPSYNSESSIEETLESVKSIDYPRKEILVINDSQDQTPEICKSHGIRVIQSRERLGKPKALNRLAEKARGKILFFVDADTVVSSNCLKSMVPWLSRKGVGAVAPKYAIKNKKNLLTRLASLDNYFISTLFKTQMFFGSLVTFRGCAVAMRRDVFDDMGGWSETLVEDIDFSAKLIDSGYRIQYEPGAMAKTNEPETVSELKKQRLRWSKGSMFSFAHYPKLYVKKPQFALYLFPYIFLCLAVIGFVLWQSVVLFLPLISLYLIYAFSVKEFLAVSLVFVLPFFTNLFATITTGSMTHMAILTYTEKNRNQDLLLIIPYIFFYLPFVMSCYIKGIISGISARRKKRPEMEFTHW